jgi:hypothetical protein
MPGIEMVEPADNGDLQFRLVSEDRVWAIDVANHRMALMEPVVYRLLPMVPSNPVEEWAKKLDAL